MNIHSNFHFLVCEGLGYCCEWAFFYAHKNITTGMIATRLGCDRRTVNYHRKPFREGALRCDECKGCLRAALYSAKGRVLPPERTGGQKSPPAIHKTYLMFRKPKGVS